MAAKQVTNVDLEARESLRKIITEVTTTGEWLLDNNKLKEIKTICKKSDKNVESAFENIMIQLNKKHAQIRYSALQIIEQLFLRSHHFRQLVTMDFPTFLQLTIGTHKMDLPPPEEVAARLKELAIIIVKQWHEKFGDVYKQIDLGYEYLKNYMNIQFDGPSIHIPVTRQQNDQQREIRIKAAHLQRFNRVREEYEEDIIPIEQNLQELESCFEILIPKYEESGALDIQSLFSNINPHKNVSSSSSNNEPTLQDTIDAFGLGSKQYKLTINISSDKPTEITESVENSVIFDGMRENYRILVKKYQVRLSKWINILVKTEIDDKKAMEALLKQLINLKRKLQDAKSKAETLGLSEENLERKTDKSSDQSDEEDVEFEEIEVPTLTQLSNTQVESSQSKDSQKLSQQKDRLDISVSSKQLPPAQRIFPLALEPEMQEDVTYARPQLFSATNEKTSDMIDTIKLKDKGKTPLRPEKETREELLARAPVVPWGDDLYYWEKKEVQFNQSGLELSHRFFGVGEGQNSLSEEHLEKLKMRAIFYKPKLTEIKACRYPLRNGTLCPRQDKLICPFHGAIIPRDELGRPDKPQKDTNQDDFKDNSPSTSISTIKNSPPLAQSDGHWEELEGEVMEQVGVEIVEVGRRKRKAKDKIPSALINLKKRPETPKTRLQKRISDRKMVKFVQDQVRHAQDTKAKDRDAVAWQK